MEWYTPSWKASTFRWFVWITNHLLLECHLTWHWHTVNAHISTCWTLTVCNLPHLLLYKDVIEDRGYPNTILCATSRDCQYSSGTKDVEHRSAFKTRKIMRLPNIRPHCLVIPLCSCPSSSSSPSLFHSLLFFRCGESPSCICKASPVPAPVVRWRVFLCI